MHSHAEHGNEEALAILSRFVFIAYKSAHNREDIFYTSKSSNLKMTSIADN